MRRPIVFACDAAYAMPLASTLRSIVEANRRGDVLDFNILSDDFPQHLRDKVFNSLPTGSASICWVPIRLDRFKALSTLSYISKMTYARFLIADMFRDGVSRVLYLDADILVLDDLGPIWETNLEGRAVGAVLDGLDGELKAGPPCVDLEAVPRVLNYFNAGVLLVDLYEWRKQRISEKALEYLIRNPRTPYSDQDALNVVCDGLWTQLDPRWNVQIHYHKKKISEMVSSKQTPGIVHFVTKMKPWNPSALSVNAQFYDSVRSRTLFARTAKEKLEDSIYAVWYRCERVLRRYPLLLGIAVAGRRMLAACVGDSRRATPNISA